MEQYNIQLQDQLKRGLCTTSQFNPATQAWHWCQNRQHARGKKKKCISCLAASKNLKEQLIAQRFCRCKRDHPEGRGCPDRLLREGRVHLITQEQSSWYWQQILTNDGKIDLYDRNPLTPAQESHMRHSLGLFFWFTSNPPPSLASLNSSIQELRRSGELSRRQKDWMIVWATMHFSMWHDPELDLKKKVKVARSQAIKDGMEAARLEGRPPGRPRIQK